MFIVFLHFVSFLIGSIPFGYIIAYIFGVDIRSEGSGNTGATNVGRSLGKAAGVFTLLLDLTKGIAACALVWLIPYSTLMSRVEFIESASTLGFIAILGHCFTPFLKGNGGKGVATGVGIFIFLAPWSALIAFTTFILVVLATGYVSLGSIIAAISVPVSIFIGDIQLGSPLLLLVGVLSALLIILRHRDNITRIRLGTESRFRQRAIDTAN